MGIKTIKAEEILADLNTNIRKVELCAFAEDDVQASNTLSVQLPANSLVVFAIVNTSGEATNIKLADTNGGVYTEVVSSGNGVTFLKGSGFSNNEDVALQLFADGETITADVLVYYTQKVTAK